MSHTLTVTLRLECDGIPWPDHLPLSRTIEVDFLERFRLARMADEAYEPLPQVFDAHLMWIRPAGRVRIRAAGQTTSNVPINKRGCWLIFGAFLPGDVDQKASVLAEVENYVEGLMGSGPPT